ncbi:sensor domain-containing diguanylate cyclase [Saccharibacillus qingshengii]|uniref:sensor domain-containing diguanylate cyclase n=1 Tax=Saccharibacillus qingshengii TaxID=1763540 RepID=UPI001555E705|nr:sensor domain-containing diguanylate cyclase [Saccharibacillus qingshengii]
MSVSERRRGGREQGFFRKKGRISLRALFSGLVVLTFLLTLVITLFASYRSEKELLTERVLNTNHGESQRIAQTMNMFFLSIRTSLSAFTGEISELIPAGRWDRIGEELQQIQESSGYFESVFVAGTDGKIREMHSLRADGNFDKIDSEAMEEALAQSLPGLSIPYRDADGEIIVLMSEPLYNENGVDMGTVGGTVRLQDPAVLGSLFGVQSGATADSYYYVVDDEAKLIYHPDKSRIGDEIPDSPVVERILRGESGKAEFVDPEGRAFLIGYASVPANGWGVVTQTANSLLNQQQMEQIRGTLVAVLLPFLILVAGTLFLARRLAAPFVALANFVVRAADRPREVSIPDVRRHWNREADLLNRAVMLSVSEMRRQNLDLTDFALRDSLTGLPNRRALDEAMEKLEGDNRPFSLLLIDIDRFKLVNDRYGHAAGDEVLCSVAHTLEQVIDSGDMCGRYGGEEFVVLLPGRNLPETYEAAERFRVAVAAHENSLHIPVTLSIGASISPQQATSTEELFELADRALYRAKEGGRNRVVM